MRLLIVTLKSAPGYNIAPPVGIFQLRHYLVTRGIACDVLDREMGPVDPFIEQARNGDYDVIGFSVSHVNMEEDLDLIWHFRDAVDDGGGDTLFIAGGQEATLNWRQWLELGIDAIFTGFPEKRLFEFCRRIHAARGMGGPLPAFTDLLEGIDGVAFRDAAGAPIMRPAPPLDHAEFRELIHTQVLTCDIPYHRYWDRLRENSADTTLGASAFIIENARVFTSSHCPRGCGFCNSQSFLPTTQGGPLPIIMLDAIDVAEVVRMYAERFGATSILFSDDDFPVGSRKGLERLTRFCKIAIADKESGRIPTRMRFHCQARVLDFTRRSPGGGRWVDRPVLELMAKAGFHSIGIGVETFVDRILKAPSVRKSGYTVADACRLIDVMLEVGLVPQVNVILGIPEYTVDELATTIGTTADNIVKGCDVAVVRTMFAFPGAPVYEAKQIPYKVRIWHHPRTGRTTEISDNFIPHDPAIAQVIDRFDDAAMEELQGVIRTRGWEGKTVHKRVVSLTALLGVAKLIDKPSLAKRIQNLLNLVLDRELAAE